MVAHVPPLPAVRRYTDLEAVALVRQMHRVRQELLSDGELLTVYDMRAQVSPVSICLVRNVQNTHVFLIRLPRSGPHMYTCVAGFADPGESLAETTRREVAEEIGLAVDNVTQLNETHSWPFPVSSLMCAFTAVADMEQEVCYFIQFTILWSSTRSTSTSWSTVNGSVDRKCKKHSIAQWPIRDCKVPFLMVHQNSTTCPRTVQWPSICSGDG